MVINATLLVQTFNFFGAYLLLRFLFFKPVVKALQEEQKEKESLELQISEREKKIEQLEEEKKIAWQKSLAQFKEATPSVVQTHEFYMDIQSEQNLETISKDEIDRLATDVHRELVKKVQHDE